MDTKKLVRGPESNLGSALRVRRDLAQAIRNVVLTNAALAPDKFELLLDLFRADRHLGFPFVDDEGFVTLRALGLSLGRSQSHISRQVQDLKLKGWVEVDEVKKGEAHHGNSLRAHLSNEGKRIMEPVWAQLQVLGSMAFDQTSSSDRQTHFEVNQSIRQKLRSIYRIDGNEKSTHPLDNILSINKLCNEIMPAMRRFVLAGKPLGLEEADILVDLYGAWRLHWPDPRADREGFVGFDGLLLSLVHTQTASRVLLSRRIREMEEQGRVSIRKSKEDQKYLGRNDGVRITAQGETEIIPIWEKYKALASKLLEGVSSVDREIHLSVNEAVLQRLRPAWTSLI